MAYAEVDTARDKGNPHETSSVLADDRENPCEEVDR